MKTASASATVFREKNRSFSGPPSGAETPSVACGDSASESSDSCVVLTADQLKALLQWKESSPDDLLKLLQSATGATGIEAREEDDTTSQMSTATDDDSYLSTSDGGSTVHEKLEDSDDEGAGAGNIDTEGTKVV